MHLHTLARKTGKARSPSGLMQSDVSYSRLVQSSYSHYSHYTHIHTLGLYSVRNSVIQNKYAAKDVDPNSATSFTQSKQPAQKQTPTKARADSPLHLFTLGTIIQISAKDYTWLNYLGISITAWAKWVRGILNMHMPHAGVLRRMQNP